MKRIIILLIAISCIYSSQAETSTISTYKSLDDYIATSSATKSKDGYSYNINPIITNIKKVYIDLRKNTTNGSYCFLSFCNEKNTKTLEISSRGLQSSTAHSITVNRTYTSIKKLADNRTYNWLYYNPSNSNEVIIKDEINSRKRICI